MIRGLLGDSKPGESKQLELKTGQVVRGVVQQVSDDGMEAVVQIQGVQVKAKLETPLEKGQSTLLQVQPAGDGGTIVLKPLADSNMPIPGSSMTDVLKAVGLSDTKENREMIKLMQQSGIPLTKENVTIIQQVLSQKPSSVSAQNWIQSAAIALNRGLPITAETVKGLHQAVFGPPLHQLIANLEEQVTGLLVQGDFSPQKDAPEANRASGKAAVTGQEVGGAAAKASITADGAQLLTKLQSVLGELRSTLAMAGAPQAGGTARAGQAAAAGSAAAGAAPPVPAAAHGDGEGAQSPSPGAPSTQDSESWVGRVLKLLGAEHEQQVVRAAAQQLAAAPPQAPATAGTPASAAPQPAQAAAATSPEETAAAVLPQPNVAAQPTSTTASATAQPTGTTATAQSAAGLTVQSETLPAQGLAGQAVLNGSGAQSNPPAHTQSSTRTQEGAAPTSEAQTLPLNPSAEGAEVRDLKLNAVRNQIQDVQLSSAAATTSPDGSPKPQDVQTTLKGLLLQVLQSDDVPPQLKNAAEQLVGQLTGQQLLLTTDRTAPFAQVTFFIPLEGPDGSKTASIHIQSRRGKHGELDPSNCHLWFDLDMKNLGNTLVDVQVVDKIVSLKVYNDQDWVAPLLEDRREEISSALEGVGYQLSSLRTEPLPQRSEGAAQLSDESPATAYAPDRYKGVDFRI
nr:hypothetical protein [Paenibacillus sediminis]